ncbi:hypothetical protein HQ529_04210 [Candidatus Woesearchaeota archaeon]|nr:hypothetical protein [Candidatus Woesearchaeota archaeon]
MPDITSWITIYLPKLFLFLVEVGKRIFAWIVVNYLKVFAKIKIKR